MNIPDLFAGLAQSRAVGRQVELFGHHLRQGYTVLSVVPCFNCEGVSRLGGTWPPTTRAARLPS